jgi:hypothetical protein
MARIRSVHPGLASDEVFMSMSMAAKAAWALLWTECDDHGIFEWKPIVLKARIFPADSMDFNVLLEEYIQLGCIQKVEREDKPYGLVRNFCRYQRPQKPSYRFPIPPEWEKFVGLKAEKSERPPKSVEDHSDNGTPPLQDHSHTTTVKPNPMKEEGGKRKEESLFASDEPSSAETAKKSPRASRIPDDWRPSPEARQFSIDELGEQRAKNEFAKFCDYWRAKGGKDATKLDWNLTWRNWIRTAKERVGSAPREGPPSGRWLSTA